MEPKISFITEFSDVLIPTPIWNIYTKEIKPLPDPYIRVTELISSPLRRKLLRKYYDNISKKINKIHYQILGTMIHLLFELKEFQEILEDMRLAYELEDEYSLLILAKKLLTLKKRKKMSLKFEDFIIQGEFDLYEDNIIYDFKVTSEFVVNNQKFDKYEKQLQVYRYMYEKNTNDKVLAIKNVFFIRDYSPTKSKLESPLVVVEYPIWDNKQIENYIKERLELHRRGTYCSDEDMLAVIKYKVGNRYFSDEEKAKKHAKNKKIEKEVTFLGCMYFCEVADFCPQWQIIKNQSLKIQI